LRRTQGDRDTRLEWESAKNYKWGAIYGKTTSKEGRIQNGLESRSDLSFENLWIKQEGLLRYIILR